MTCSLAFWAAVPVKKALDDNVPAESAEKIVCDISILSVPAAKSRMLSTLVKGFRRVSNLN